MVPAGCMANPSHRVRLRRGGGVWQEQVCKNEDRYLLRLAVIEPRRSPLTPLVIEMTIGPAVAAASRKKTWRFNQWAESGHKAEDFGSVLQMGRPLLHIGALVNNSRALRRCCGARFSGGRNSSPVCNVLLLSRLASAAHRHGAGIFSWRLIILLVNTTHTPHIYIPRASREWVRRLQSRRCSLGYIITQPGKLLHAERETGRARSSFARATAARKNQPRQIIRRILFWEPGATERPASLQNAISMIAQPLLWWTGCR